MENVLSIDNIFCSDILVISFLSHDEQIMNFLVKGHSG